MLLSGNKIYIYISHVKYFFLILLLNVLFIFWFLYYKVVK